MIQATTLPALGGVLVRQLPVEWIIALSIVKIDIRVIEEVLANKYQLCALDASVPS